VENRAPCTGEEVRERGSVLRYEPGWRLKLAVNGLGACVTAVVLVVFAAAKFRAGAWITVLLVPTLVVIFFRIHHHYRVLAASLTLKSDGKQMHVKRHQVLLPIVECTRAHWHPQLCSCSSNDITAVYVAMDPAEAEAVCSKWEIQGEGVRLVILDSPTGCC